jgi:hypothetical protein
MDRVPRRREESPALGVHTVKRGLSDPVFLQKEASMRRLLAVVVGAAALGAMGAPAASAGQPNQDCATVPVASQPPGFQTGGFANAEGVYAATSGTHSAVADNSHTVAQYDVACIRKSAH